MGDPMQAEYMRGRRILEINPSHPIIESLKAKVRCGGAGGLGFLGAAVYMSKRCTILESADE